MDDIQKFLQDLSGDQRQVGSPGEAFHPSQAALSHVLRVIGPFDQLDALQPTKRRTSPQDWSNLIERVRAIALRSKEVEAEAQEQEMRVRELLERVKEDMRSMSEREKVAEARVRDVTARTNALLKAAEEQVEEAEERARVAEDWLSRIQEAIMEEFPAEELRKLTA